MFQSSTVAGQEQPRCEEEKMETFPLLSLIILGKKEFKFFWHTASLKELNDGEPGGEKWLDILGFLMLFSKFKMVKML